MDDENAAALLAEKFTSPIKTQSSVNLSMYSPMTDREPVQAYAKLEGDSFSYYIRTLQVTLGRKAVNSENADITLGTAKSISRHHAKVCYNFLNQRFELIVLGKNGAFINDQFVEKGTTIPLEHRTKIQIGELAFCFLLPKSDPIEGILSASTSAVKVPLIQDFSSVDSPNWKSDPQTFDDINRPDYTNIKPPYSYASLIAQAINSTTIKKMTLNGIYNYITSHYPYYQLAQNGWQNSIRHNLSLNKAFVKVPRADGEPGKGAFWTIDQNYEGQFSNGVYKRNRRSSKTSREDSASPFASPVDSRRKSTTSISGEAGTLLSPLSMPPKFPNTDISIAPPPPPVFLSNLLRDPASRSSLEPGLVNSKEPSTIENPPPATTSQPYEIDAQNDSVRPESPRLHTKASKSERLESPICTSVTTTNATPLAHQESEDSESDRSIPHELSDHSAKLVSKRQSELTPENS
ncbi:hypothetical protein K7432_004420 [Basidiobolus ranarum]|uniref:Uncharacterized protein n=1 Tax=Basidiobolus ranarum TaxID=34480 RepID=A0ABR2WY95_9FUNG